MLTFKLIHSLVDTILIRPIYSSFWELSLYIYAWEFKVKKCLFCFLVQIFINRSIETKNLKLQVFLFLHFVELNALLLTRSFVSFPKYFILSNKIYIHDYLCILCDKMKYIGKDTTTKSAHLIRCFTFKTATKV